MTHTLEDRATHARQFDQARSDAFVGKVLGDTVGLATTAMASIGDRLGLFKDLASSGPSTSSRTGHAHRTHERYVREWLGAMANAEYLEYDPTSARYTFRPSTLRVLAQETDPVFFGGVHEEFVGLLGSFEKLLEHIRSGGGLASRLPGQHVCGHRPVHRWLVRKPAVPAVATARATHSEGSSRKARASPTLAAAADRALIKLAQAFPESRFIGYEIYGPNVDAAMKTSAPTGLEDRITIRHADAVRGPGGALRRHHHVRRRPRRGRSSRPCCAPSVTRSSRTDATCVWRSTAPRIPRKTRSDWRTVPGLQRAAVPDAVAGRPRRRTWHAGSARAEAARIRPAGGLRAIRRIPMDNPFNALYELTA